MYLIRGLCPRTDIDMGRHAFTIELPREWPALVEASEITQERVSEVVEREGADWLDACGYTEMYDPDNYGFEKDKNKPPGPNAKRLYDPHTSIRVSWGAWGPEHITVPGNACGLDLDHSSSSFGCFLRGGRMLLPHNIDSWHQKNLLLIVFTEFAESVVLLGQGKLEGTF
jgi:hypothetical protein